MYYVYVYKDPETLQPFYVGKGKQNRSQAHQWLCKKARNKQNTRFYNKLDKMLKEGIHPIVEFAAQNIQDEQQAYQIESDLITRYGRFGYDENGILLNICIDSRPPNHKGKTYEEIYGDNWQHQIETRRATQLARGGFGPKKHSQETIDKIKNARIVNGTWGYTGVMTPERKKKMSEAKLGKYTGVNHHNSKLWILISPQDVRYNFVGGDLSRFCLDQNLSKSTLDKNLGKRVTKGKTKGWMLTKG